MSSDHTPPALTLGSATASEIPRAISLIQWARMSYCGVVEVRSLEDVLGATCGRSAKTPCSDCGISLCSAHTERCELCSKNFCQPCLTFHQREHSKPAEPVPRELKRKAV